MDVLWVWPAFSDSGKAFVGARLGLSGYLGPFKYSGTWRWGWQMGASWAHHFLVVVLHPPQPSLERVDSAQRESDHAETREQKTVEGAGCAASILQRGEEPL